MSLRRRRDRIGYCCFTPQDILKPPDFVELDLRSLPPFERHNKIFALANGSRGAGMRPGSPKGPNGLSLCFQNGFQVAQGLL
jgi:hypothetical protein